MFNTTHEEQDYFTPSKLSGVIWVQYLDFIKTFTDTFFYGISPDLTQNPY